jgi:hypothetical protein
MKYLRISIMLIAALTLFSLATIAQDKGYMPTYYSVNSDPGNTELDLPPWEEYLGGPVNVPLGQSIWIGVANVYDPDRYKDLLLMIQTTDSLNYDEVIGYDTLGNSEGIEATLVETYAEGDMHYYFFKFVPQPGWEVIKFTNTVSDPEAVIVNITASSICRRAVPSLTSWGLIILVLMILAAGYMVYRRRANATA